MGLLNKKKNKPKAKACKTKNKTNKTTKSKTTTNKKQPAKRSNTTAKATAQKTKTNTKCKKEKIYPRDEFQKNRVTGHPAHIEGYAKKQIEPSKKNLGDFIFRGITHKKNNKNRKLDVNPNKKDKRNAYIDKKQSRQKVELFEKDEKYQNFKIAPEDKNKIK